MHCDKIIEEILQNRLKSIVSNALTFCYFLSAFTYEKKKAEKYRFLFKMKTKYPQEIRFAQTF